MGKEDGHETHKTNIGSIVVTAIITAVLSPLIVAILAPQLLTWLMPTTEVQLSESQLMAAISESDDKTSVVFRGDENKLYTFTVPDKFSYAIYSTIISGETYTTTVKPGGTVKRANIVALYYDNVQSQEVWNWKLSFTEKDLVNYDPAGRNVDYIYGDYALGLDIVITDRFGSVVFNGTDVSHSLEIFDLSPGRYIVTVTSSLYKPLRKEVDLSPSNLVDGKYWYNDYPVEALGEAGATYDFFLMIVDNNDVPIEYTGFRISASGFGLANDTDGNGIFGYFHSVKGTYVVAVESERDSLAYINGQEIHIPEDINNGEIRLVFE